MIRTNEEIVAKILAKNEILYKQNNYYSPISERTYDLGKFLSEAKKMPSRYGEQYLFVK